MGKNLVVEVNATVTYSCFLGEKESEMVRELAEKKMECDDAGMLEEEDALLKAVEELYGDCDVDFDLYKNSSETDFCTEDFVRVEEFDD